MDNSYWRGRNTGQVDSLSSMIGAMDRRADQQARERARAYREEQREAERRKAKAESDAKARREEQIAAAEAERRKAKSESDAKVICSESRRQNLMSKDDYILSFKFSKENLSDQHYRGYHFWALAAVRHMRRSRNAASFWSYLARARADHIAYLYGNMERRNRLGAVLCAIGHPACYILGRVVRDTDWRSLYREEIPRSY